MPDNAVASEAESGSAPWLSSNLKLRIFSGARSRRRRVSPRVCRAAALRLSHSRVRAGDQLGVGPPRARRHLRPRLLRARHRRDGRHRSRRAGYAALAVAVLAIAAITLIPLYIGRGARLSALGVFYVGLPAVALLWLRSDEPFGFTAVLFVFAVVWSSDTAAYAAGRSIGGPKLWPRVSPNKTWAGLVGALCAGAIAAAVFAVLEPEAAPVRLHPHRRRLGARRAGRRPRRIRAQASVQSQGCERSHPRSRRLHGPHGQHRRRRRRCRASGARHRSARPGARAAVRRIDGADHRAEAWREPLRRAVSRPMATAPRAAR